MPHSVPSIGATAAPVSLAPLFADECALFLDIDGTLAPLAPTPDDAAIPQETLEDLNVLFGQLNGALAFVSGRSITDIDRLSGSHSFPAAALHGLEIRRPDGEIEMPAFNCRNLLDPARMVISDLAARNPELFVEDKDFSLAVHYRRKPELEHGVLDALRSLQTACAESVFLQEGKLVGELRLRGGDKGTAIQRLLTLPPFQGRRPIFAGDDKTDEDAFRTVIALGGIGIKIGDGETVAQQRLASPAAFHDWLSTLRAHFASTQPSHTSSHS